jgi:dTDP-4-dehydrorhamnose 3,5-epimerase
VRGLHLQLPPHDEGKALRCVRGRVFDVAVDLRPDSPTYLQSSGVELGAYDDSMVYVPAGCAHGYQTLADESTVLYQASSPYTPGVERGLRWDDPLVAVDWPITDQVIVSEKDQAWPTFDEPSWHVDHDRARTQGSQR